MDIKNLLANIKLRELQFTDFAGLLFASIEPLSDPHKELAAIFSLLDTENISNEAKQIIAEYLIVPPSLDKGIQRLSKLSHTNKLSIYMKVYGIFAVSPLNKIKVEILYKIRSGFHISKKEDKRLRMDFVSMKNRFSTIIYRAVPGLNTCLGAKSLGLIGTSAAALGLASNFTLFGGSIGKVARLALFFATGFFLGFWLKGWRAEQIREETKIRSQTVISRLGSMIDILNKKLVEIEEISDLAWYKEYYDRVKRKVQELKDAKRFYESLHEICL
jgi:hypothetical protein